MRSLLVLAAMVLGASPSFCLAAAGPEDEAEPQDAVRVTGLRNPAEFDARKGAKLIDLFLSIPEAARSRIRLSFYVKPLRGDSIPAGLQLVLYKGDQLARRFKVLPSGEVEIQPLSASEAYEAQVVSNVPTGSIQITYFVQPVISGQNLRLGNLREAMGQVRTAWATLYGPFLGWTVPRFDCVRAYYALPSQVKVATDAHVVVWQSDVAKVVTIPLNHRPGDDDLHIDWGPRLPDRVGGCLLSDAGHKAP